MSLRIVQFGLGPIGQASARLALDHGHQLVGALDLDPDRVGRDVGEVLGRDAIGAEVRDDVAALQEWKPDVVLHTTLSFLDRIEDQLLACIEAGAHVVSSSEELFWPFDRNPGFCERIDRAATEAGVAVVGTGVNPGFVMDLFPVVLANSVIARVDRVDVSRSVDAGRRRGPLQRKVGAGLTEAAFREKEAAGGFGHIGMVESAKALAAGLGWDGAEVTETFGPHLATADHQTEHASVKAGDVAGIHQTATVTLDGEVRATLTLTMAVGAKDEDRVEIAGDPPLTVVVEGGTFGDTATVAAVVNTARRIGAARPGLRTVLDLPAAASDR